MNYFLYLKIYIKNIKYFKNMANAQLGLVPVLKVGEHDALFITICPGKKEGTRHNRDLNSDLQFLKQSGITTIVSLMEYSEYQQLQIPLYPYEAQKQGFKFLTLPIKDRKAPDLVQGTTFIKLIAEVLMAGERVMMHCKGGLGRSGTIAACVIVYIIYKHSNSIWSFDQIYNFIRGRRPGAIQTRVQVNFIKNFILSLVD